MSVTMAPPHKHTHGHDHAHHHGHGHTHGVVDPSVVTTERGIWAIQWSFAGLMVTALAQVVIVVLSGSVALLADSGWGTLWPIRSSVSGSPWPSCGSCSTT